MEKNRIPRRLEQLRKLMVHNRLDYYLVPSRDVHNNENVPPCWHYREWVSGFTGSAGTVLVGMDRAFLFTDSRYFIQAARELRGSGIELLRQEGFAAAIPEWFRPGAAPAGLGLIHGKSAHLRRRPSGKLWRQREGS